MLKTVSTANGLVSPTFSGNVTLSDGNLVIGTSGKGIDFSATPGTGTSELLNDYEEGTWTPTDGSGAGLTFLGVVGTYTKIGNTVRVTGQVTYPSTADVSSTRINGLPFTPGGNAPIAFHNTSAVAGNTALILNGVTFMYFYTTSGTRTTNANYSTLLLYFSGVYYV